MPRHKRAEATRMDREPVCPSQRVAAPRQHRTYPDPRRLDQLRPPSTRPALRDGPRRAFSGASGSSSAAPAVHLPYRPGARRVARSHDWGRHSARGLRNSRIRSPARRFTIVSMNTPDTTTEAARRGEFDAGAVSRIPAPRPMLASSSRAAGRLPGQQSALYRDREDARPGNRARRSRPATQKSGGRSRE
jgi:hypothetical protein